MLRRAFLKLFGLGLAAAPALAAGAAIAGRLASVPGARNHDIFIWRDDGGWRHCWAAWASDVDRGEGEGSAQLQWDFAAQRWVNAFVIAHGPPARQGVYLGTIRSAGKVLVFDSCATWHFGCATLRPVSHRSSKISA